MALITTYGSDKFRTLGFVHCSRTTEGRAVKSKIWYAELGDEAIIENAWERQMMQEGIGRFDGHSG